MRITPADSQFQGERRALSQWCDRALWIQGQTHTLGLFLHYIQANWVKKIETKITKMLGKQINWQVPPPFCVSWGMHGLEKKEEREFWWTRGEQRRIWVRGGGGGGGLLLRRPRKASSSLPWLQPTVRVGSKVKKVAEATSGHCSMLMMKRSSENMGRGTPFLSSTYQLDQPGSAVSECWCACIWWRQFWSKNIIIPGQCFSSVSYCTKHTVSVGFRVGTQ